MFFEFDPSRSAGGGSGALELLSQLGYRFALVYENRGELVGSLDLQSQRAREDLVHYYSGRGGALYADLSAYHIEDEDLFELTRSLELEHFQKRRGY